MNFYIMKVQIHNTWCIMLMSQASWGSGDWYWTRSLISWAIRTAVIYVYKFWHIITHKSVRTLLSSFYVNPTAISESKPPLSYYDKSDILWVNCIHCSLLCASDIHHCYGNDWLNQTLPFQCQISEITKVKQRKLPAMYKCVKCAFV